MPNSICNIYFTNDGVIPAQIIANLKELAVSAKKYGFVVDFWTDASLLQKAQREELLAAGVMVRDYNEVNSPLKDVIQSFVVKGHAGDRCAYNVASKILRVVIANASSLEDIYIYANCDLIKFLNLEVDLKQLADTFKANPWGFALPIIEKRSSKGEILLTALRNDCMIVCKKNNPHFFSRLMKKYVAGVLSMSPTIEYIQAFTISSFASSIFETLETTGQIKMVGDSETAAIEKIAFARYMQAEHCVNRANNYQIYTSLRYASEEPVTARHSLSDEPATVLHRLSWTLAPLPSKQATIISILNALNHNSPIFSVKKPPVKTSLSIESQIEDALNEKFAKMKVSCVLTSIHNTSHEVLFTPDLSTEEVDACVRILSTFNCPAKTIPSFSVGKTFVGAKIEIKGVTLEEILENLNMNVSVNSKNSLTQLSI